MWLLGGSPGRLARFRRRMLVWADRRTNAPILPRACRSSDSTMSMTAWASEKNPLAKPTLRLKLTVAPHCQRYDDIPLSPGS